MKMKLNNLEWNEFQKKALQNRIFLRASEALMLSKTQKDVVEKTKKRNKKTLDIVFKIQKELEKRDIKVVVIKTFDNYPDFGNDADFLIDGNSKKTDEIMLKVFNAKKTNQSTSGRVSKKEGYLIRGSSIAIEFHYDGFSQIGEKTIPASQIIENRRKIELDGKFFYVPSLEDSLLITVIHRIYRHISIRFSDVYNTKKLLENKDLDWNYILNTARKTGIISGLVFFLRFVKNIDISDFPNISMINDFPYYIIFFDFLKTYIGKLFYDGINLNLDSLFRMIIVYPMLLTITFFSKKLFKEQFTW